MPNYAKTYQETIRGKVKWAKTKTPNKFGRWSVDVYPDAEGLEKIQKLKESPAIKNVLKQDEDGKYMTFSRDTQKLIRGKMVMFEPPIVLQPDPNGGEPIPLIDKLVGNFSDCDVWVEIYGWNGDPLKGRADGRAARFKGLLVWNLVPFESKRDFTTEERIHVSALTNQAPMPQW